MLLRAAGDVPPASAASALCSAKAWLISMLLILSTHDSASVSSALCGAGASSLLLSISMLLLLASRDTAAAALCGASPSRGSALLLREKREDRREEAEASSAKNKSRLPRDSAEGEEASGLGFRV